MYGELVLKMRQHLGIAEAENRSRCLAAIDGIDDEQLLRSGHEAQKLHAERAAVEELYVVRKVVGLIERLHGAYAEALILQHGVADAEHSDFRCLQNILLCHVLTLSWHAPARAASQTSRSVPRPSRWPPRRSGHPDAASECPRVQQPYRSSYRAVCRPCSIRRWTIP